MKNLPNVRRLVLFAAGWVLVSGASAQESPTIWFDRPATHFTRSLPLGNGRLGAMVFGGTDVERIVLNESSMWSGSRQDADRPDAHLALPEIRRLLLAGRNGEAEALVNAHFTCQGSGSGHGSGANVPFGCYQVLGNLHLRFAGAGPEVVTRCLSGHRAYSPNEEIPASTDASPQTKWCLIHEGRAIQWQLDAGREARPEKYTFTSANDVPARDPRSWKLEGSPDGAAWSLLDERRDEAVFEQRHQSRSYPIPHAIPARFFRFTFQPNPGVTHFQVAEIEIDGVVAKAAGQDPEVKQYRRTLDLATATARVDYERHGVRFQREHFISAPDEVFVSRLTADQADALS